jgi:zinc transport system substrate-binding protein
MKIVNIFFTILAACLLDFSSGAFASPLQIFVSIPPQKWLVDQVGGKLVSTHVLVDRGQEPHNFEPTPKQVAALFRSQLFFTVDMEFEREISRKISQSSSSVQILDVTRTIHKIPITGQKDRGGNSSLAEGSRYNGLDPHVWLAPANLKIMATEMASSMAAVDPANKSVYELNVETVVVLLDRLDKEIQHMLAPYAGLTFYVFHPAFGYFAHAYNLYQEAVEIEGKSPSPRQLYSLISRAKAEKVKVVFVQPQFDRKSAQAVAHAIGGEVVPLDPLAEDVSGNLKIMAEKIQSAFNQ